MLATEPALHEMLASVRSAIDVLNKELGNAHSLGVDFNLVAWKKSNLPDCPALWRVDLSSPKYVHSLSRT
jgi:hypothetical protein